MRKLFFIPLLLSAIIACKKDDDDVIPAPFDPQSLIFKQGFISGTLAGNRQDGTAYTKEFKYQGAVLGDYFINEDSSYSIRFQRINADVFNDYSNSLLMSFRLPKANDTQISGFNNIAIDLVASMPLDGNRVLQVKNNPVINGSTITISNIQFNKTTGAFKADYSLVLDSGDNTSKNPATISNGKIDIGMIQQVYRIGQE